MRCSSPANNHEEIDIKTLSINHILILSYTWCFLDCVLVNIYICWKDKRKSIVTNVSGCHWYRSTNDTTGQNASRNMQENMRKVLVWEDFLTAQDDILPRQSVCFHKNSVVINLPCNNKLKIWKYLTVKAIRPEHAKQVIKSFTKTELHWCGYFDGYVRVASLFHFSDDALLMVNFHSYGYIIISVPQLFSTCQLSLFLFFGSSFFLRNTEVYMCLRRITSLISIYGCFNGRAGVNPRVHGHANKPMQMKGTEGIWALYVFVSRQTITMETTGSFMHEASDLNPNEHL